MSVSDEPSRRSVHSIASRDSICASEVVWYIRGERLGLSRKASSHVDFEAQNDDFLCFFDLSVVSSELGEHGNAYIWAAF